VINHWALQRNHGEDIAHIPGHEASVKIQLGQGEPSAGPP